MHNCTPHNRCQTCADASIESEQLRSIQESRIEQSEEDLEEEEYASQEDEDTDFEDDEDDEVSLTKSELESLVSCDTCGSKGIKNCEYPDAHQAIGSMRIDLATLKNALAKKGGN